MENLEKEQQNEAYNPLAFGEGQHEIYYRLQCYNYGHYLWEFRARHPIMYYLWYRWWFMRFVPAREVSLVKGAIRDYKGKHGTPRATFAMYHPILFFVWLVLCFLFQLAVKALTAPVKVIRALKVGGGETATVDELRGEEKLA